MRKNTDATGLDTPVEARHRGRNRFRPNPDSFGQTTETFARFMELAFQKTTQGDQKESTNSR